MNVKDITDAVTAFAAFVGVGLGVYNLLVEKTKRKVRVQVQPKTIMRRIKNPVTGAEGVLSSSTEFNANHLDEYFAIEAVNLSNFPVTIDCIGFQVSGQSTRMTIIHPIVTDGGEWPRKLEPRESVTAYGQLRYILSEPGSAKIKYAFAETSCGVLCKGTSGALKGLVNFAKQSQLRSST
jgi:hypothetical protein